MKIRIPRQDLLTAVNKVRTVVAARTALPILSHILFEAEDGQLRLSATDLKVGIECTVDCAVESPGSFTLIAQKISSLLTELPSDAEVTLELCENNIVALSCNRISIRLYSMSPDEFPPVRRFDAHEPLVLSQAALRRLFHKTSFSLCQDQTRYTLTGLLFELANGQLTVVSTDGRRMSLAIEDENIPPDINIKVIIPGKMILELERLMTDSGDVNIYLDESQAAFAFSNVRLVTALIEGNFPNYEMVIPKKHDKEAIISTDALIPSLRRTRQMTNEKFNNVRFILSDSLLHLKVTTPELGEFEEQLVVDYAGEKVEIAFNPDFVLDVLGHVESEKIVLALKDSASPGLIKPYTEAPKDKYLNVVMPIRI